MTSMTTPIDQIVHTYKEDSIAKAALLMCVLGAVFYCYEYYLRVAPSVIQPQLMQTFNISQAGLGTLVAYYYLAYVPLQIPVGLMMDYWGPRLILTFACICCAVGTFIFAGTEVLWMAKLGRFLVGFGSAFAFVGVLKIANLWLPHKYFAMMVGLCTALGMFGAMSGGIFMTKFVELIGWQQALYASALIGVILAVVLWCVVRDHSRESVLSRFFSFITVSLSTMLWCVRNRSVSKLSTSLRSSPKGNSIWFELLEVMKTKQLWLNGIIGCLTFLPLTAFAEFWSVSYLEKVGLTKDAAALGSSMVFLGYAIGGPMWGRISEVVRSRRQPLMLGSVISAAFAVYIINSSSDNLPILFTVMFMLGFFASAQILVFAVGEDNCRPGMSATTVSFTNFLVMLGGFALQPLVGIVLDYLQTVNAQGQLVVSVVDFKIALLVLPLGLICAAALTFFTKESYHLKS